MLDFCGGSSDRYTHIEFSPVVAFKVEVRQQNGTAGPDSKESSPLNVDLNGDLTLLKPLENLLPDLLHTRFLFPNATWSNSAPEHYGSGGRS